MWDTWRFRRHYQRHFTVQSHSNQHQWWWCSYKQHEHISKIRHRPSQYKARVKIDYIMTMTSQPSFRQYLRAVKLLRQILALTTLTWTSTLPHNQCNNCKPTKHKRRKVWPWLYGPAYWTTTNGPNTLLKLFSSNQIFLLTRTSSTRTL